MGGIFPCWVGVQLFTLSKIWSKDNTNWNWWLLVINRSKKCVGGPDPQWTWIFLDYDALFGSSPTCKPSDLVRWVAIQIAFQIKINCAIPSTQKFQVVKKEDLGWGKVAVSFSRTLSLTTSFFANCNFLPKCSFLRRET